MYIIKGDFNTSFSVTNYSSKYSCISLKNITITFNFLDIQKTLHSTASEYTLVSSIPKTLIKYRS